MSDNYIEIIGYIAMALIAISFLMKNIRALRILNMLGAGIFVIYGILLNQPPIYLLNSFILIVNLYFVFIKKTDKQ
ncbi:MAG: uroporphyrinogen decarboxylase [Flavobacteriales bacterium]